MSKKNGFGKFIVFCAAIGAAAAGAYYYLSKRDEAIADDFDDDDYEDFDDFEDDDYSTTEFRFGNRKYVDISPADNSDLDEEPEKKAEKSEEFFDDEK